MSNSARKPQNKCAVTSHPAGHEWACGDCDPCLFGSFPSEWCGKCEGVGWFGSDRCYVCGGSGFRDSDGSPKGGDGEAGSVHDSAGPKDIAQTPADPHNG